MHGSIKSGCNEVTPNSFLGKHFSKPLEGPLGNRAPEVLVSLEKANVCLQFPDGLERDVMDKWNKESLDVLVVFLEEEASRNDRLPRAAGHDFVGRVSSAKVDAYPESAHEGRIFFRRRAGLGPGHRVR